MHQPSSTISSFSPDLNPTFSQTKPSFRNPKQTTLQPEQTVPDDRLHPSRHSHRAIECAQCRAQICSDDDRRLVFGKFEHCFANPAGLLFRIGCFDAAPGCALSGAESDNFTWFAGYLWQVALCRRCGTQLGWRYWRTDDLFFGLILDRLALP